MCVQLFHFEPYYCSLLSQASQLEPEMGPVALRLSQLIRGFVLLRPTCFLLPQKWSQHGATLRSCLDLSNATDRQVFDSLARKNERLAGRCAQGTLGAERSPRQNVIHLLDAAKAPHNFAILSSDCCSAFINRTELAVTVLEWASTRFREGSSRTYVALRLLRRWHKGGMELDSAITQILAISARSPTIDRRALFHIISELVRSQSLSLGRYMQGLMARGTLNGKQSVSSIIPRKLGHADGTYRLRAPRLNFFAKFRCTTCQHTFRTFVTPSSPGVDILFLLRDRS